MQQKLLLLILSFVTIAGCTTNSVQRIESADSIIKYKDNKAESLRFANLYPGKKEYPVTCEENCYPNSEKVICEETAENCQFVAAQPSPDLASGFSVRWLGHASFHVTLDDGSNFLFDPVSKQFDWPVDWAFNFNDGFYRKEPNWLTQNEMANVDAVMYSHIHYDHFNKSDIDRLGTDVEFFAPLEFADHFPSGGYKINEMAWYSSKQLKNTNIHFVPAHHFSSRIWVPYLYEDNERTLWGGWVLEHSGKKLFFAGDTGYSEHFKDIQQHYGDMDVCLIPIASYFHPRNGEWYRYVHTTPEDALIAAGELNCKVMIPWGYGNSSWKMGDHSSHSSLLRLLHMHKELESTVPLHILNEGETIAL